MVLKSAAAPAVPAVAQDASAAESANEALANEGNACKVEEVNENSTVADKKRQNNKPGSRQQSKRPSTIVFPKLKTLDFLVESRWLTRKPPS